MPRFWPSVSLPGIRFQNQFSCRRWCQSHGGIWLPWSAGPKVSQQNSVLPTVHPGAVCSPGPRGPAVVLVAPAMLLSVEDQLVNMDNDSYILIPDHLSEP